MFSELDRTYIRRYIGVGATFVQAVPLVEQAMTAVQSIADGGSRPDASTENEIKGIVYGTAAVTGTAGVTPGGASTTGTTFSQPALRGLLQIEAAIAFQDALVGASEAEGDAKIDPYREMARLRNEGQRMCNRIAKMLGMRRVFAKIFFAGAGDDDVDNVGEEIFNFDARYW